MSGSSDVQPDSDSETPQSAAGSRSLVVAITLALVWYACLLSLILFAEPPVTVNRVQLLESHIIVVSTVDAHGGVAVTQTLKGDVADEELQIELPHSFPAGDWVLPLRRTGDGFEITTARLPNRPRLVYPVGDDVIADVQRIVSEQ